MQTVCIQFFKLVFDINSLIYLRNRKHVLGVFRACSGRVQGVFLSSYRNPSGNLGGLYSTANDP